MRGIPPVLDTDSEDVAWALQTAEALWLRNERVDAIVWLRRAAQAAGDASDNTRALTLARSAVDLAEWLTGQPSAGGAPSQPAAQLHDSIEELLNASAGPPPAQGREPGAGLLHPWTDEETRELRRGPDIIDRPLLDDQEELTETVTAIGERVGKNVLPLGPNAGPNDGYDEDDDVVTSANLKVRPRGAAAPSPRPPPPPPKAGLPPIPPRRPGPPPRPVARENPPSNSVELGDADLVTIPPPLADSQTIHLPPAGGGLGDSATQRLATPITPPDETESSLAAHVVALEDSVETMVHDRAGLATLAALYDTPESATETQARGRRGASTRPPPASGREIIEDGSVAFDSGTLTTNIPLTPANEDLSDLAADPDVVAAMPQREGRPTSRPVDVHKKGGKDIVDLEGVDALNDIPEEERDLFASKATLHDLSEDDEIANFALALVVTGDVDVVATVLDAHERLPSGTVLRGRGTNEKGFELRLVCRSKVARVATWPGPPVEAAFRACPWVEDDLRIATDRIQALVGITSGPLADRMDASLRNEVVRGMTSRALAPGETLLKKGETVPGLYVVGVGGLELVDGAEVVSDVIVGDFVFPTEVLGAGSAPHAVRAPRDGAVVLFADRRTTQELMVTCPPLLEILAGM